MTNSDPRLISVLVRRPQTIPKLCLYCCHTVYNNVIHLFTDFVKHDHTKKKSLEGKKKWGSIRHRPPPHPPLIERFLSIGYKLSTLW